MKLAFGLGNPGNNYEKTRHNVGFMALDALAVKHGAVYTDKPKFLAHIAEAAIEGEKVLLVKPQTFYNDVGRSYRAIIDFYKLTPSDTLVIHDELALPFGTLRTRLGGSDAGNNGVKSINTHGGASSARLRVGIGNDQRSLIGDTDFVLGRFTADESVAFTDTIVPKVIEVMERFAAQGLTITSHNTLP